MNTRMGHLRAFALLSLSFVFAFAAQSNGQQNFAKQTDRSSAHAKAGVSHRSRTAGAASSNFSVLYSFCSSANCVDGANPAANLIQDSAGNSYGTTEFGGANTSINGGSGGGTAFEVDTTGVETVLYSFGSSSTDGYDPAAGLVADAAGNLYGTTYSGGTGGGGTVFELVPPAQKGGAWTETVLHNFCAQKSCVDGGNPVASVILDAAGNLYGTTVYGGPNANGTVYEVSAGGIETVLYAFEKQAKGDGANPESSLIQDAAGNLYGTTFVGGQFRGGTVFKVTQAGQESVLYSFCTGGANCPDGQYPEAALIQDATGNFYGTTTGGGTNNYGAVFELSSSGAETVLYSFCAGGGGCTDGAYPFSSLVQDAAGNLYGTTEAGGSGSAGCVVNALTTCGTVFELAPPPQPSGAWSETVLYSFCSTGGLNCTDGAYPEAGLIEDSAGNLYGTTSSGGVNVAFSGGTVFKVVATVLLTPTVTMTSAPNPSNAGQAVTLSVVVSGSGSTPTGSVTFEEGTTALGTVTLANGKGSLITAFPAAGSFSITAAYAGDGSYKPGTSNPITQVVNLDATTTALASSPNPSTYGQPVTLTATVSSAGPTPTGTVTFKNGTKTVGSASLSGGIASLTTSALPVGTLKLTASYGGDAANNASTSPALKQGVSKATSATALMSSPNPSKVKQKVTFTATVTSPTATPTGSVTFFDGTTKMGTAVLKKGAASYTTAKLTAGTHNITAVYAGTANIGGSTSPVLIQTVN